MVYITKTVEMTFEEAIEKVTEALKEQGFGIITEIDVTRTLKEKIDVDFRNYRILGACNPHFAHKALKAEEKIGVLLPCNVVVQQHEDGTVEVTTFNPVKSMPLMNNPKLEELADDVECKLNDMIKSL